MCLYLFAVNVRGTPAPWQAAPVTWLQKQFLIITFLCLQTSQPQLRCSVWPQRLLLADQDPTAFASALWREESLEVCFSCSDQTGRPASWSLSSHCSGHRSSAWMWKWPSTWIAPSRPNTSPGSMWSYLLISSDEEEAVLQAGFWPFSSVLKLDWC